MILTAKRFGWVAVVLGLMIVGRAEAGFVTTALAGSTVETFNELPQNYTTPSPLVLGGNTFTVDPTSGTFRVLDYGVNSDGVALGTNDDLGSISVALGTPQTFVGADVSGSGFTFSVFGAGGALLGSATGTGQGGVAPTFIGFQADPGTVITAVTFTDTETNGTILVIDNFTTFGGTTSVPEPSSLALCGLAGLIGLGYSRARRRRAV